MESLVSIVLGVLYVALLIVFIALWARFILDWVQVLNRGWRPRGAMVVLAEVSYTITDPPIRTVRRVVPPLRLGGIQLDLAFMIVLFVVWLLMNLVRP
ncbi:YggT family protein [Microcella putealis]|uniref:YggT family protein n=1 Tax=Microcella putealis TaxID=337005 RepID=A0A4Q7LJ45_9MICO|nr:YggT family protein [Microcella putealis]RZS54324.1 YggT family protein [Microcella putealis]TQM24922.1 YggT family protein [Microcella putealis]HET8958793.1 YggT family protein [Microcella sp.]